MERKLVRRLSPNWWIGDNHGKGSQSFELGYVRQIKLIYSYARQKEIESQKLDCHLQSRRDIKYTDYLLCLTSTFTCFTSVILQDFCRSTH